MKNRWMVCDVTDRNEKSCLFNEESARGDPPRCIRHGALLFGAKHLDGLSQDAARKQLDREHHHG
jgi:hypothetical protein